jgi:DNA repair exonuclease SbcCD ATPase subunit
MNVTSEIKNKEKTLAELMVKILKEPLDPLKGSVKKLHEEVLDTKDKVEEINDALNAAESTEEIIKPLKKTLRELQEDDIPQAIGALQTFISQQVEEKRQDISSSLSQQSAHYDSQLIAATGEVFEKLSDVLGQQHESVQAAIQQYQQTGIDGAEALSQQLLAVNQSLEDASADNASEQRSTRERDQRLAERLENVMQTQQQVKQSVSELKQSISELDQQLKGVSQGVQTARTTLAERQESDRREVLSGLATLSTDVQVALVQHLTPTTQATESLQTSLEALTEAQSQQKSHLEAQIAASQGRFRYVVIIFALYGTSTLAYIGYDIWKNLAP